MTNDERHTRRAQRLIAELALRGIDPMPTIDNARGFLDLLDPSGDEYELAVQVADWISDLYAEEEEREYEARALIERARDKYWNIRRLKRPPAREKELIRMAQRLTAKIIENRRRARQPQSPGGPASGRANP